MKLSSGLRRRPKQCRCQAAAKALEAQKYMIRRQDVIDELMTWDDHCITDAEQWHLRQVIGSIKSIPGGENDT